jgi:uncharacterized membrane protein YoaK (UPF0700 family)
MMVASLTVAMGVQNVTIRKIGGLNIYTTLVTGSLVKFGEAASEYVFWLGGRLRRIGYHRFRRVMRATLRQRDARHMALTGELWLTYLAGAIAGTYALDPMQTRCILFPLLVLIAIAVYGALRPFAETVSAKW